MLVNPYPTVECLGLRSDFRGWRCGQWVKLPSGTAACQMGAEWDVGALSLTQSLITMVIILSLMCETWILMSSTVLIVVWASEE